MEQLQKCKYEGCEEPVNSPHDEEFCVFHAPVEKKEISVEEFNRRIFEKIHWIDKYNLNKAEDAKRHYNFSGYIFPGDIILTDFTKGANPNIFPFFNGHLSQKFILNDAIFDGDIKFVEVDFHSPAEFKHCTFKNFVLEKVFFEKGSDFTESIFKGSFIIDSTNFQQQCSFNSAIFEENCDFKNTNIPSSNFDNARFMQTAKFEGIKFYNSSSFKHAFFNGLAEFIKTEFLGNVSFEEANFLNRVSFIGADFSDAGPLLANCNFFKAHFSNANFAGCTFNCYVDFMYCLFQDKVTFNRVTFKDAVQFNFAKFSYQEDRNYNGSILTTFNHIVFEGIANFHNTKFDANTQFISNKFEYLTDFSKSQFKNEVDFIADEFRLKVDFSYAEFENIAKFENTLFKETALFHSTYFHKNANFAELTFMTRADFLKATFDDASRFFHIKFNGATHFAGNMISKSLRFIDIIFGEESTFSLTAPIGTQISNNKPMNAFIYFEHVLFKPFNTFFDKMPIPFASFQKISHLLNRVDIVFRYCQLKDVYFTNNDMSLFSFYKSSFEQARFVSCKWAVLSDKIFFIPFNRWNIIYEEELFNKINLTAFNIEKKKKLIKDYKIEDLTRRDEIASLYRSMKTALDNTKDYQDASWFYFNEFEMKRLGLIEKMRESNNKKVKLFLYFKYHIYNSYKIFAGFGEKPHWSFLWFIIFSFIFTICHMASGIEPIGLQNISPDISLHNFTSIAGFISFRFIKELAIAFVFAMSHALPLHYFTSSPTNYWDSGTYGNIISFLNSFVLIILVIFIGIGLKRHFRRF